jgi:predicted  nucleic acid-binding Zn-ribbon protein
MRWRNLAAAAPATCARRAATRQQEGGISMGSARDFLSSSMADALLPSLKRSFEDVVYETLDQRQVPTRTDFKDLRDQINGLRGQITGATGGVKKLSEDLEALDERLGTLEGQLAGLDARFAEIEQKALATLPAEITRLVDERLARLSDTMLEHVVARLGQRLSNLEARLSEAWLDARILRAKEDAVTALSGRIDARVEARALDARLDALRADLQAGTVAAIEALRDELSRAQPAAETAAEADLHEAAIEHDPAEGHDGGLCLVPDCGEPRRSKGFCARHYQQWRRGKLEGFPHEG